MHAGLRPDPPPRRRIPDGGLRGIRLRGRRARTDYESRPDGGAWNAPPCAEAGPLRFKDAESEADADGDRSASRGSPMPLRGREPGVGVRRARDEPEGEGLWIGRRRVSGRDLWPPAPATRGHALGRRVAALEITPRS